MKKKNAKEAGRKREESFWRALCMFMPIREVMINLRLCRLHNFQLRGVYVLHADRVRCMSLIFKFIPIVKMKYYNRNGEYIRLL